jgi:hypothetical protein
MVKFKKTISLILSFIMMWSCTSDYIKVKNENALNQYVRRLLEINSRYDFELLNNDSEKTNVNDFDVNLLQEALSQNNHDDIKEVFDMAGYTNPDVIANLIVELNMVSIAFADDNPEFSNYSEEEIEVAMVNELNLIFDDSQFMSRSCASTYQTVRERCERAYTFSVGVSLVVGLFTGGVGAAVGTVVATINGANCIDNAFHDYMDCIQE